MQKLNYKILMPAAGILILLLVAILIVSAMRTASQEASSPSVTAAPVSDEPDSSQTLHEARGIITGIDLSSSSITISCIGLSEPAVNVYTYDAGTRFITSYNRTISPALLNIGDFVDISCGDDLRLTSVTGSSEVWSYQDILNLAIDTQYSRILIGDTIYRYDSGLLIYKDEEPLSLGDLASCDVFSVYGIDNYIYLIDVTSGHGFLTLSSPEYFLGAELYIDGRLMGTVSDGLSFTLSEGSHTVQVVTDDVNASADLQISPFETSLLDLEPYAPEPAQCGLVAFTVDPDGADLYIDGVLTSYEEPVSLEYGTHTVTAELGGYLSFNGNLTVSRAYLSFAITLQTAVSSTELTDGSAYLVTPTPVPASSDGSSAGSTSSGSGTSAAAGSSSGSGSSSSGSTSSDSGSASGSASSDAASSASGSTSSDSDSAAGSDSSSASDSSAAASGSASDADSSRDTASAGSGNTSSGSTGHTLTICCTEGSAVFIDDVYKGLITDGQLVLSPCPSGSFTVRFTLEGYKTARYSIEITDYTQDYLYRFPDMILSTED